MDPVLQGPTTRKSLLVPPRTLVCGAGATLSTCSQLPHPNRHIKVRGGADLSTHRLCDGDWVPRTRAIATRSDDPSTPPEFGQLSDGTHTDRATAVTVTGMAKSADCVMACVLAMPGPKSMGKRPVTAASRSAWYHHHSCRRGSPVATTVNRRCGAAGVGSMAAVALSLGALIAASSARWSATESPTGVAEAVQPTSTNVATTTTQDVPPVSACWAR